MADPVRVNMHEARTHVSRLVEWGRIRIARADDLTLVTADRRLTDYDVPVLLARQ